MLILLSRAAIIPTNRKMREVSEERKSEGSDLPVVKDLKPNRKLILEHVVRRKDVFAALPIGFGQSLAFQILPSV